MLNKNLTLLNKINYIYHKSDHLSKRFQAFRNLAITGKLIFLVIIALIINALFDKYIKTLPRLHK